MIYNFSPFFTTCRIVMPHVCISTTLVRFYKILCSKKKRAISVSDFLDLSMCAALSSPLLADDEQEEEPSQSIPREASIPLALPATLGGVAADAKLHLPTFSYRLLHCPSADKQAAKLKYGRHPPAENPRSDARRKLPPRARGLGALQRCAGRCSKQGRGWMYVVFSSSTVSRLHHPFEGDRSPANAQPTLLLFSTLLFLPFFLVMCGTLFVFFYLTVTLFFMLLVMTTEAVRDKGVGSAVS